MRTKVVDPLVCPIQERYDMLFDIPIKQQLLTIDNDSRANLTHWMIVAGKTQEAQTTVPETFADVEAPIEVKN